MALFVYQLTEGVDTVEGLYLLTCLRVEVHSYLYVYRMLGLLLKGLGHEIDIKKFDEK
jgi:hypothetical protein